MKIKVGNSSTISQVVEETIISNSNRFIVEIIRWHTWIFIFYIIPEESFLKSLIKGRKEKSSEKKIKEVGKKEQRKKAEKIETIERLVEELKKLWEENEKEIKKMEADEVFSFISSLSLPETSPVFLEDISNKFLKEFDWKRFEEREYFGDDLGLFLSAFLEKNIRNHISSQENKGIELENIKPIEVCLKVEEIPVFLNFLGYQNPKKLLLTIEGSCGLNTGEKMQGGKIIIEGNCNDGTGFEMEGGKINVKGSCRNWTGYKMKGGEINVEENCRDWAGNRMRGGRIIIGGDCGDYTGGKMEDGELNIKGEVRTFDKSAFSSKNQGTIIVRGSIEIWKNGNWTKEGREMLKKKEFLIQK